MDENKFCFITCIKNKEYYDECLYYINDLNIPEGYDVEIISIEDEVNIAKAYNTAMNQNNAKYKIYFDECTFIIEKNFLYKVLETFKKDRNIGAIGVKGGNYLKCSGLINENNGYYGRVTENDKQLCNKECDSYFNTNHEVKYLEGILLITQYDVLWRQDLLKSSELLNISQSIEFRKNKYKLIVPYMKESWIIYDQTNNYINIKLLKNNASIIKNEYEDLIQKDDYPLIDILVIVKSEKSNIEEIISNLEKQLYYNINIHILIFNKHIKIDKNYSENVCISYSSDKQNRKDNINRLIRSFIGRYIFIMDENIRINYNTIDDMYSNITKPKTGAVCTCSCDKKTYTIENRKLLVEDYKYFMENNCYLINRKYYVNYIGRYFDKDYENIMDFATICNISRFSSVVVLNDNYVHRNSKKTNLDSITIFYKYVELFSLANQFRNDSCFDNITEYQKFFDKLEQYINNIIDSSEELNNIEVKKEMQNIIESYKISTCINFKNLGINVEIRKDVDAYNASKISIGNNVKIGKDDYFMVPPGYDGKIVIKDNCDLGRRLFISASNSVKIESDVIIASNVHITDHNHEYREIGIPIMKQGVSSATNEVVIGQGSWIANNCVIVGNVKIGRGCTIGANSVVTSDIPDYSIAAGKPAKVIKYYNSNIGEWVKVTHENEVCKYQETIRKQNPILTIGIPTYNRSCYLDKCLDSIYSHIGNDNLIEVLVVDNASTDATYSVVEKYKDKYTNLKYIRRDETIWPDDNVASIYDLASGEFINCHGDDDYYNGETIYKALNSIMKNRDIALLFTMPKNCTFTTYIGEGIDDYIKKISYIVTLVSGTIIKKSLIEQVIKYKKDKFCFNQIIYQLESLKINKKFAVLSGNVFKSDSGEHKPYGYSLAEVFIKNYLDILNEYKKFGLSEENYKIQKEEILNEMIIHWLYKIKKDGIDLKVDDLIYYYNRYYKDEKYYKDKLFMIEQLIGNNKNYN